MADPLLRVALTGGIATGKSYALNRFAALGAAVLDTDVLARRAVEPGTPGLASIVSRFGQGILTPEGHLDRKALAQIVFHDLEARRDLEAIIHPIVYEGLRDWFAAQRLDPPRGDAGRPVAIAAVPLLYETGHEGDVDRAIVAACRPDQQIARLIARDGMSPDEAEARIAAQFPIGEKRRRADYVVDTSGSVADTDRDVDAVWARLQATSP